MCTPSIAVSKALRVRLKLLLKVEGSADRGLANAEQECLEKLNVGWITAIEIDIVGFVSHDSLRNRLNLIGDDARG
jgi:hypothetical protein